MEGGHRISEGEDLGALRRLLRRETVPLEAVQAMLESRGLMDERDKRARGQAIAGMMRYILQDPEVTGLLETVLQVRRLGNIERVFEEDRDYRFAQLLAEGFWKEHSGRKRQMEESVVRQLNAVRSKLAVLDFLAGKLTARGYSEELEIPDLDVPFPPLPPGQKGQPQAEQS